MPVTFAIGSNGSGQLGIGHKEDVSVPKQVFFKKPTGDILQVRAGGNHTLLLDSTGSLHVTGDHTSGACGLASESNPLDYCFEPACLSNSSQSPSHSSICFIAATWEGSIIVRRDTAGLADQIYAFGIGNKGELGLGDLLFRSSKAEQIQNFPPAGLEIVDVAASVSHVVAVLSNGEVYGWGNGRKGQLGAPEDIVYSPRKISGPDFKVVRVVCGREFTYLLGEPNTGRHAVLGSDKWQVRSSAPPSVVGWKDIGACWGTLFVLLEDGTLKSWGRGDHGQLAPQNLPLLSQFSAGSEHVVALTVDQEVLAWGWGEHGNCGPNTKEGDVKDRWNVIASPKYLPPEHHISRIGAGCATSWIYINN